MGNPGSINNTLFFPGVRCVQAIKEPYEPATLPTVGMHERGEISISKKALTKRDASCFNSGTPLQRLQRCSYGREGGKPHYGFPA